MLLADNDFVGGYIPSLDTLRSAINVSLVGLTSRDEEAVLETPSLPFSTCHEPAMSGLARHSTLLMTR